MLLSQLTVHRKKRANNTEIRRKLQMTYTKVAAHYLTRRIPRKIQQNRCLAAFSDQTKNSLDLRTRFAMVCSAA